MASKLAAWLEVTIGEGLTVLPFLKAIGSGYEQQMN
jgi:hypothetical protein